MLENPKLIYVDSESSQKERRAGRICAPGSTGEVSLYQTDGASRKEQGYATGPSSFGAAYWLPGRVLDRAVVATPPPNAVVKIAIGYATNNIAEYCGLREALRRAVRTKDKKIIFEVDSDVVARQMAEMGAWVCRAESVRDLQRRVPSAR